ncbi:MAG TPA: tRNA pseudouridine(55) synthase TruB [Terriglobales bacterium]|nr:tRNA pseudouridine(55) synthase TruB [Terriglobales bacterium]
MTVHDSNGMNGVIVINKPAGLTSHDVVNRVRRISGEKSVGHLGTLDPMATGVLPLVAGRMTRLAQFYTTSNKCYEGEIRFGFSTDTYDAEGEPSSDSCSVNLSLDEIRKAAKFFVGRIEQMPPPFSAKKIQGVPAYKLARKNRDVELKAVEVEVREFEITTFEGDRARFTSDVSSGTYIRSLAHDLGRKLGCGAHLSALCRTRSGEFGLEDAITLEALEQAAADETFASLLVHPRRLLPNFPCVTADEENVARISNGRSVNLPDMSKAKLVKVFAGQSDLIAIASRVAGTLFHPKVVLMHLQ